MIPNYELLKSFVVFAGTGNMIKAAKLLKITQPALTQQLKRLEGELPISPFSTQGNKKTLSTYGLHLFEALKPLMTEIPDILERVNMRFSHEKNARLRIAGRREILERLSSSFPFQGSLEFQFASGEGALDLLKNRQVDLIITQKTGTGYGLISKKIFSTTAKLVVGKKLYSGPLTLETLKEFPFKQLPALVYNRNFPLLQGFLQTTKLNLEDIHISRVCEDWLILRTFAEQNLGWSIFPSQVPIKKELVRELVLEPPFAKEQAFYLMYLKDFQSIPWFKQWIDGFQVHADFKVAPNSAGLRQI